MSLPCPAPRAVPLGTPAPLCPDPAPLTQGQRHRWLVSPRLRSRLPQREPRQLPVQPQDKVCWAQGRARGGGGSRGGEAAGPGWGVGAQGTGLGAQALPFLICPATHPAEWGDPATEDADVRGPRGHLGGPPAHLPPPHHPACPALQPARHPTEPDCRPGPGSAGLPPGNQPG